MVDSEHPAVSIVIPLYNCESHIGETIESVLAQTFKDFELVVVDDLSTDRSAAIAEAFDDPRIRLIRNPDRQGFAGNWNRCLAMMRGTYCKLLPHDDPLEPTCLEEQVRVLEAHPDVELVHCARNIIDPAGRILARRGPREKEGIRDGASSLKKIVRSGTNPIGEPAAVMFRYHTMKRIGLFSDEDMYSIDIDYWSRLLNEGDRYYIDKVLSSFRVWPDSASVRLFGSQSRSMRRFFRRMADRYPQAVRPVDVWIGSVKSVFLEAARGGFYFLMKLKNR